MKIISKFHDYYDSAQGYGYDPALVFNRRVEEIAVTSAIPSLDSIRDILLVDDQVRSYVAILAFCGKCYPLLFDISPRLTTDLLMTNTKKQVSQTKEEFVESFAESMTEGTTGRRNQERERMRDWAEEMYSAIDSKVGTSLDAELFLAVNAPYFLYDGSRFFTNPRLSTLGFSQHLDAFSAYQEISMFLGSVLAKEAIAPSTVGDDEVIARSKGFDEQSFRMPAPGRKKLNRKRNKEGR